MRHSRCDECLDVSGIENTDGLAKMKVLLFSDLHLDTQFAWVRPESARRRRHVLRDVLSAILDLAERERVDAVMCGGDLYEHDRFTPDTAQFLRSAFERLHPTPVLVAPGNHDWFSESSLYRRVSWSPNVHVFTEDRLRSYELADGLTIWGGAHLAPANTDNFLEGFHVDRAGVNVALFHGSERIWFLEQGEGKAPHAAFDAVDIERSGLQHALLGHFHKPKQAELFTYPGNPDPLTFGEVGERGAVLVEIDSDGRLIRTTHEVARSQVHDITFDVTGCTSEQDVRDSLAERLRGLTGSVRVTLSGELGPDPSLNVGDLPSVAPHLDGVLVRVADIHVAYDFTQIEQEATVRGEFVRSVRGAHLDPDQERRILVTGLRALEGRSDLEVD